MAKLVIRTQYKTHHVPLLLCNDLLGCYTTHVISSLVKEALNHQRLKVEPSGHLQWLIYNGKLNIGSAIIVGDKNVSRNRLPRV